MSDRVAVMSGGRVEQVGTPEEIYARPRSEAVAAFVGAVTLIDAEADDAGRVRFAGQAIASGAPAGRVRVAVRPENVEVHAQEVPESLSGSARECAYLGHGFRVRVAVANGLEIVAYSRKALATDQPVWLRIVDAAVLPGEGR